MKMNKNKILIMEDDKKIATALGIRLEAAGYEVITAGDGFEGLKLARDQHPDLIIMDIWMPVGLGFSVAQRLKSLGLGHVPVIFITASKVKGLRQTATGLGAAAFFEKPYNPDELLLAVSQALEANHVDPSEAMVCDSQLATPTGTGHLSGSKNPS
jgi:DNA-binding response OmpR family regulator